MGLGETRFSKAMDIQGKKRELKNKTAKKQAKEADPSMDRRAFLRTAGTAVAGITATYVLGNGLKYLLPKDVAESAKPFLEPEQPAPTEQHHGEQESEEERFARMNRDTALPVTAAFGGYIIDCAFNGGSLGPKSAAVINGLELLRLGILNSQGGEEGKHLAAEEMHENLTAATLAGPLIAISDFTTTSIRVNEQAIFDTAKAGLDSAEDNTELQLERPALEASQEEWEHYLENTNRRLIKKVTELQALTSILAPFLTTYTSSAVANQLKEGVLKVTFDQSYAMNVIDRKKQQQPVEAAAIQAQSIERANELLNGPWGFTNLETTLAANIHGGILAGDPPQLFGVANHWGNWSRIAKGEAFGLANDALMTYGLTATWLNKTGALGEARGLLMTDFAESYAKATRVFSGMSAGRMPAEQLAELRAAVAASGIEHGEEILNAHTTLQLSIGEYAERKFEWIKKTKEQIGNMSLDSVVESITTQVNAFVEKGLQKIDTFTAILNGDKQVIQEAAELNSSGLTDAFTAVMPDIENADTTLFAGSPDVDTTAYTADPGRIQTVSASLDNMVHECHEAFTNTQEEMSAEHQDTSFLSHSGQEVLWALSTQMSAVGPTAVLAEQSINSVFDLRGGEERSSKEKVLAAATAALTSEAVLSSLADNIAAYMYAEKLLTKIVQKVYGKDIIERFPRLGDVIYATALKIAEQAGPLTKLGNGANFSQEKITLEAANNTDGYTVKRSELPFELYSNRYAVGANVVLIAGSLAWLGHELTAVEESLKQAA